MVVVENTPEVHNVIVCTLCSCYPWPVLGLPPSWYKSPAYRARVVAEPRAVLAEFGLELDADVEVRVWDSTAEVRYLVLPMRPPGTESLRRGGARGARHPRQHGRHRAAARACRCRRVTSRSASTRSPVRAAPRPLPRRNGELVFEAPWESRAFGVAVALQDAGAIDFEHFRAHLIAEISEHAGGGRRRQLLRALARRAAARAARAGVVSADELDRRAAVIAHEWAHDHDHKH